jgi:GTPase SAR1 family protein
MMDRYGQLNCGTQRAKKDFSTFIPIIFLLHIIRMTRSFYRGAHGVLLCFDLNNPTSFEDAKNKWLEDILSIIPLSLVVLVGMKSDKPDITRKEKITAEAKRWSVFSRISYFETSSVKYQGMDDPILPYQISQGTSQKIRCS